MERDRFLTEAMGRETGYYPTYEDTEGDKVTILKKFNTYEEACEYSRNKPGGDAEQSWSEIKGWYYFGEIWGWVQSQEWFWDFLADHHSLDGGFDFGVIKDTESLADAVYAFLTD